MIDEAIREAISESTGVPADLLTGDDFEQCCTQARTAIAFKRDNGQLPNREAFADWFNGRDRYEEAFEALEALENEMETGRAQYPNVRDAGEVYVTGADGPTRVQFEKWFKDLTAFNPHKHNW